MGPVEGIEIALSALTCAGIAYLAIEQRRVRKAIEKSDEAQREHREQMIEFGADVLRRALDDGKGRVLVIEPGKANDNATEPPPEEAARPRPEHDPSR
jgi:hypothetical protein